MIRFSLISKDNKTFKKIVIETREGKRTMKTSCRVLIHILVIQLVTVLCFSQDFDFFYFVQQWPGSYCDTKQSCCYPTTGKPDANFGIHGLWPNYDDGSYPSSCDSSNSYDPSQISDLIGSMQKEWPTLACPSSDGYKFWSHEWIKHGTCAESVLDQHGYFEAALNLKKKANLLQALEAAGIKPDGSFYSVEKIKEAIKDGVGFTPGIECNVDTSKNHQLYQVFLCVDTSGSNLIECPITESSRCGSEIEFPSFGSSNSNDDDDQTDYHKHKDDHKKQPAKFDFFYFVQQWPGSYCDTKRSCCYPTTGKPAAEFGIHGLWPNYDSGSYPSNCDSSARFDPSAISDLMSSMQKEWPTLACPSSDGYKFWSHEWTKHGTCAESILDQHGYFEAGLNLKKKANLLQALESAGIKPDGGFYSVKKIKEAIKDAIGFTPGIECNVDTSQNHQLYQVYLCVDTSGSKFIECPIAPSSRCGSQIEFPSFGKHKSEDDYDHTEHDHEEKHHKGKHHHHHREYDHSEL